MDGAVLGYLQVTSSLDSGDVQDLLLIKSDSTFTPGNILNLQVNIAVKNSVNKERALSLTSYYWFFSHKLINNLF